MSRKPLPFPPEKQPLLMHTCCAPCSGEVIEAIQASGIPFALFFYNPNIHPQKEYDLRKSENIRYAEKVGLPFIDADYDTDRWFERVQGLEEAPERGERCSACFDMRFERTALYAFENGYKSITSCLGISRWKDMDQINRSGHKAAARYPDLIYWDYNWRKEGGSARMYEIAKEENFYKQEYCGCIYSLRDSNKWRMQKGEPLIRLGQKFY